MHWRIIRSPNTCQRVYSPIYKYIKRTNERDVAQRSWPSGFVTWQPPGLARYHPLTPSHTLTPLRGIKKYKLNLQKSRISISHSIFHRVIYKLSISNAITTTTKTTTTASRLHQQTSQCGQREGGRGRGCDRIHISQSHSRPNRFRLQFQTIDDADDDFAPGLFGLWGHAAALWLQLLLLLLMLLQWQLNCEMIIFIAWPGNKMHPLSLPTRKWN